MPPPTMIMRICAALVRRDPRLADDNAVALVVGRDQFAKALTAREVDVVAQRREAFLRVGLAGNLGDLAGETIDDVARRLGGSGDPEPDADVEPRYRVLIDRRHLRENRDAFERRDPQRLHLAGLDELNDGIGR